MINDDHETEIEHEPEPEEGDDDDYCRGCGHHQEDCACGEDEPQEGDLITEDHTNFFTVGESYSWPLKLAKPDVVVPDDEDWRDHVGAHMDEMAFWPDVWFISDHGNTHRMTMFGGDR